MAWIVVRNWRRYQHYHKRRGGAPEGAEAATPTWIKLYVRLLNDETYLNLTGHQRGVLHGLWLLYAASGGQLTDDTASLSRRLGLRVTRETLDSLNDAGFIELSASNPLGQKREEESREEETREEDLRF